MTDHPAILRAILANRDDDTPRGALADWLDDHAGDTGDPRQALDRAEFIRAHLDLARWRGDPNALSPDGIARHSEIRARIRAALPVNGRNARAWFDGDWWEDGLCNVCVDDWCSIIDPRTGARYDPPPRWRYRFVRGFVEQVECSAEAWLTHGDTVTASHPIRRVELTTRPPEFSPFYGDAGVWGTCQRYSQAEEYGYVKCGVGWATSD